MNSSDIPASIKEASPHNFSITINDLCDPNNDEENPEIYVRKIIWHWVTSITSELLRAQHPKAWDKYPEKFAERIVKHNKLFPTTIPIGYVLVSFLRSVYPKEYRLDQVKQIFNIFIMAKQGDLRKEMKEAYRKGEMYVVNVNISLDDEDSDGMQQAKSLYEHNTQEEIKFGE